MPREKTELSFSKYSGTGNTFVIFKDRTELSKLEQSFNLDISQIIRFCCDPLAGVSADGGFLLERQDKNIWGWSFFNSDGSPAEMCGNAARCAAHVIFEEIRIRGESEKEIFLNTTAGLIRCEVQAPGIYSIQMNEARWIQETIEIEGVEFSWVDTGVPHAVFKGESMSPEKSRHFRHHQAFSPRGANITSYKVLRENELQAVSYERGVENFTQACGTGAVAAALVYWSREYQKKTAEKIRVQMPGGTLEILLVPQAKPIMSGPAVLVGEMKLSWENISTFFKV